MLASGSPDPSCMAAARRAHTIMMTSRKSARKRPVILAGSRPSGWAGCASRCAFRRIASHSHFAKGSDSHRLDYRLLGAPPVHDLLLEDVDERAVGPLLLGARRLDGTRREVLHPGDTGL